MPGYRRVGARFLALSAMVLALVGVLPLVPAASARAVSWATSRVVNPAPVAQSAVTLGDTSRDAPALWTRDPAAPQVGVTSVLAWVGTDVTAHLAPVEALPSH